jgi:hypothetical protein
MLESMGEAGDLYEPFVLNLREQVLYLGRDLSPEALEGLEGDAAELNKSSEELFAKIEEILTGEATAEKEVDEIVAEDEAEAASEGGAEAAGDDAGGDAAEPEADEEKSE